jgi:hypothetical protein
LGIVAIHGSDRRRKAFYEALRDDLTVYAERSFSLAVVGEDGFSHRDRIAGQLERTRNVRRKAELEAEISLPPYPLSLDYLWSIYSRLRRRKGAGQFGPLPIEWPDIEAFCRIGKISLSPWEIEIIETLDDLYLATER